MLLNLNFKLGFDYARPAHFTLVSAGRLHHVTMLPL